MTFSGTSECVFCGSSPTNREHIFPAWSHKLITKKPGKYLSSFGRESLANSDVKTKKGKGDIHDWQVKCVCEQTCNNGWMRTLENKARPILTPLIQGKPADISPQQQRIVSGWAVLKAIVGEYENPNDASWSRAERERVMRFGLPPKKDCFVWIGNYERGGKWLTSWATFPFYVLHRKRDKNRLGEPASDFNSSTSTQVIGNLIIHVIHGPLLKTFKKAGFRPGNGANKMARIWPVQAEHIHWPLDTLTDRDAHEIATIVHQGLKDGAKRAYARRND